MDMQPLNDIVLEKKLRRAGLRPTRQRVALAGLIFAKGDRHISAEDLQQEALKAQVPVSLATIYNTLHQFTNAGLMRVIAVEGAKTWFDTNISDHHHFYIESENKVIDIPVHYHNRPVIDNLPKAPDGMEISHVDLIIRLRKRK